MASVIDEYCRHPSGDTTVSAIASWRPDAPLASVPLALAAIGKITRFKANDTIVCAHLSERGSLLREGGVLVAARVLGFNTIAVMHGAELDHATSGFYRRLLDAVLSASRRVICLGPRMATALRARTTTPVAVIPNPVSVSRVERRATIPPGYVLFSGEVGERKGFDRLTKAWPLVLAARPDARLEICGPLSPTFELKSMERTRWHGSLPRDQALDLLASADVLVLPSRAEVLPMVILESLALGVPVVGTHVGESSVYENVAGVQLIDADNPDELAQAIVRAVDDAKLEESDAAIRWSQQTTDPSVVSAQLTDVGRALLAQKSGSVVG
ncbi:glycosyltransferase family 4 protein [Microbacterium trichothecenolyticum]